jgi:lysosomal Pro-X carboxypeptidase
MGDGGAPLPPRPSTANCTWGTFDQQIDHFGGTSAKTFPQRYCLYDKWWGTAAEGGFKAAASAPGPILFYTGNESPVEECVEEGIPLY